MNNDIQLLSGAPSYAQLRELEEAIREHCDPVDAPITHHFAEGIYGREMFIPAGTVIVGKIHRHSTLNILAQGRIKATSADGSVRELVAPCVFVSGPGVKKVGYALEDSVWINVHPTRITDLAAIEQKFIVPEAPAIQNEESP